MEGRDASKHDLWRVGAIQEVEKSSGWRSVVAAARSSPRQTCFADVAASLFEFLQLEPFTDRPKETVPISIFPSVQQPLLTDTDISLSTGLIDPTAHTFLEDVCQQDTY